MKKTLVSVALATLASSLAVAAPVSVFFLGQGDYGYSFNIQGGIQGAAAGHLLNSWTPGYNSGGVPGTKFLAYCLTPTELIGSPNPWDADRNYDGNAGQIGWLTNQAVANTFDKASVQVAIWMVMGYTITAGDAGVISNATTLAGLSVNQNGAVYRYTRVQGTHGQDLVEAVPEPFTMALGLAGLGVAIARRRKAR